MQGEVTFAGAVVGAVQAPVQRQDQRHGVFGHRIRRIGRYPHHIQAQALGSNQVHMVETGRAQGDQARATGGQAFEHWRTEVIIDEGTDHLVLVRQGDGVQAQPGILELQLDTGGQLDREEAVLIVLLAAEKKGSHTGFLVHGRGSVARQAYLPLL
ncbi:hypothetical protein D9M71_173520 [compost metagenome]